MNVGFGCDVIPGLDRLTPDTSFIRIANGRGKGKQFSLNKMNTLIGRADPPDVLPDIDLTDCELEPTPMISRRHAILQWANGQLQIIDLHSNNGTWVDGDRLNSEPNLPSPPSILKVGSKIKLANLELEIIRNG